MCWGSLTVFVRPVEADKNDSGDMTDSEADSQRARGSARAINARLAEVYERAAVVLGTSTALAQEHGQRQS